MHLWRQLSLRKSPKELLKLSDIGLAQLDLGCKMDRSFTYGLLNFKSLLSRFQVNLAQNKLTLSPPMAHELSTTEVGVTIFFGLNAL